MIIAELNFIQTVAAGALNVLFTAVLVAGVARLLVMRFESKAAERRREADELRASRRRDADERHDERLQAQQLEYQTRAALRDTYAQLLVAQRQSRQASVDLARAGGESDERRLKEAVLAHDAFINLYHRLNLDASEGMWRYVRTLRRTLDEMLSLGQEGRTQDCEKLVDRARSARQKLEGQFRIRLDYEPLQ